METYSNRKLATTRYAIGVHQADARAADASGSRLPPLLLVLALLMTGCVVVPIPANRPDPGVRTNVTPQTVNQLGTGDVLSRQTRRGGMFQGHWTSDVTPYAKRNSVFRRKGGESPIVKGGSSSRTTGAEGHPVCTSEVLGARKIGEEAA